MNTAKRNPTDGIAIASIVAKGTIEGEWDGTGGGVGYGTGGLGLFVGGMSGSKTQQSLLAKELEMPDSIRAGSFSMAWLLLLALMIVAATAFLGFGFVFLDPFISNNNKTVGFPFSFFAGEMSAWAMKGMLGFVFLVAVFKLMKSPSKSEKEEDERREKAKAKMRKIYHRLRYVEKDHIVFDPKSGMELPATEENVRTLLGSISK